MAPNNIKILDCTLRDGGYVNSFDFGDFKIEKIIENLKNAKIDFIECGFLKNIPYDKNKTLYNKIELLEKLQNTNSKLGLMINFDQMPLELIPQCKNKNIFLRIVFKKENIKKALEFCSNVKEKGYNIFINPMHTGFYQKNELQNLIKEVNLIKPYAFTIVDTIGALKQKEAQEIFSFVDKNLNQDTKICFHSHNSLQLSFSNAINLIEINKNRTLIIDSTLFGIGRGAGNIYSEILAQYLNDNFNKNYDVNLLLKTVDECIMPIFKTNPWGYSIFYYVGAVNNCHPNYVKFLIDKKINSIDIVDKILKQIPEDKKLNFDIKVVEGLI